MIAARRLWPFLLPACLAACGDLPQPFAGRPGATAMRLAHPPPSRLTIAPPTAALLPAPDATRMARDLATALVAQELPAFAEKPKPGDWSITITASLAGTTVQPRYTLTDSLGHDHGAVDGEPEPAAAWQQADDATFQRQAQSAAPKITALLQSVDAAIKQSDPNSLYNRPARIYLAGVTGAPGDGNVALQRQMHAKLPDTGDMLVNTRNEADFIVTGIVKITNVAGNEQQVEIHWIVTDPNNRQAGDVAQGHDIPHGLLDHYWGDIASVIADEAAGGVHEVITNWSGRRNAKPGPPARS